MDESMPPLTWQVVGQVDTVDTLPSGVPGPGVNVSWETPTGLRGTLFVPQAAYRDLETVRAMLAADVAHRAAVAMLGSE